MTPEHGAGPEHEPDPYWQEDIAIGEGRLFRGETYTIRMRLHIETERFHRHHEIVPLSETRGERVYIHGKPYILVPDITLSIGLYPQPEPTGAIGAVTGSAWTGMRHEDIGQAQAWFYPMDRLVMLWECFPDERFSTADPRTDATLGTLWTGFERFLVEHFPEAERIATTWEDKYARPLWQEFLAAHGYQPVVPAAFIKPLNPGP